MLLFNTLKKENRSQTPIWIMRQAGRFLPEYRAIREKNNLTDMFFNPEVIEEVTLQPIERFDFDAAIIFSDILVIPKALGMDLNFGQNSKPKLENLEKVSAKNLNHEYFEQTLEPVYNSISRVKNRIKHKTPLIGFTGGAWTLYMYMISQGSHQNFINSRVKAVQDLENTKQYLSLLSEAIYLHAKKQIEAGADIIKIFESSAGEANSVYFNDLVIEPTKKAVDKLKAKFSHIPIICFPRGAGSNYQEYQKQITPDVLAVDYFTPLDYALNTVKGSNTVLQGNLDPAILHCSDEEITKQVLNIENQWGRGEFIFNLGHGIMPNTQVEKVEHLVNVIRR